MLTTGLAATAQNAHILSEIQTQENTATWCRAALTQAGDHTCADGTIIPRAVNADLLARTATIIPILRAALEPAPAAPSAGLANLCAFLQPAPPPDLLAELDESDPLAVQVAALVARVAQLEALTLAQLAEAEADRARYQAEGTTELATRSAEWLSARQQRRQLNQAYQDAHTR